MAKQPAAKEGKPARKRVVAPVATAGLTLSDSDLEKLGETIAKAVKPDDKPTTSTDLNHINEIIKNARATWFALLGSLVFAAVTLAGVKDVGFFVPGIETKLPLAGISVPVTSFFWAGSLLIAALYIYFHLYLEKLWAALGRAESIINGKRLADAIHPWLVTDTALRVRDWLRMTRNQTEEDNNFTDRLLNGIVAVVFGWLRNKRDDAPCSRRSTMSWISNVTSVGLVWWFGVAVIFWFWWRSMPAHSLLLTGWLGLVLFATTWVFLASGYSAIKRLSGRRHSKRLFWTFPLLFVIISGLSILRTDFDYLAGKPRIDLQSLSRCTVYQEEKKWRKFCPYWLNYLAELLRPARANLAEVEFTKKPDDWLGKKIAEQEFRVRWCKEVRSEQCVINPLSKKYGTFDNETEMDFRAAWKRRWKATLKLFKKPDFRGKKLNGANLSRADLIGVNLRSARLDAANLRGANLDGAILRRAWIENAVLTGANLESANLSQAKLDGTNLKDARFLDANLIEARMHGHSFKPIRLDSGNFINADFSKFSMRFVEFTASSQLRILNFQKSFGDGSVLPPANEIRPSHWCESVLSDVEYFGRLRAQLGNKAKLILSQEEMDTFPAIHPFTPCPGAHHPRL